MVRDENEDSDSAESTEVNVIASEPSPPSRRSHTRWPQKVINKHHIMNGVFKTFNDTEKDPGLSQLKPKRIDDPSQTLPDIRHQLIDYA